MPTVNPKWQEGYDAAKAGKPRKPPYTDKDSKKVWLSGYDMAKSPIAQ